MFVCKDRIQPALRGGDEDGALDLGAVIEELGRDIRFS
jgi:hypothetical protein